MNTILQKRIEEAAQKELEDTLEVTMSCQCANIAYEEFIQGVKYALSHQWISVEEALPEYEEVVIVADKINGDYEYYFNHRSDNPDVIKDKNDFCSYRWQNDEQITHWMPIPSLKGGEK